MNTHRVIFCLAGALFIACFLVVLKHPNLQGDEPVHYDQIRRIIRGNHELNPWITTLPVYHWIVALPGLLFNKIPRPSLVRFFTFCTGLLAIAVFRATAKRVDPNASDLKTFQFAFFPILFPMFFVIYTDALSLLLVLLAYFLTERRNYFLSGTAATLAVAVRQNNILWLVFLLAFMLWREKDARWFRYGWSFFLGIIGFAVFLILNHGPAVGDRSSHPITVSAGNLFLFLFLFFLLFIPCQISAAAAIHGMLRKKKVWIGIALFFLFYMATFHINHPYNSPLFAHYLRNRMLLFFTSSLMLKIVFFLPIAYALLSLFRARLIQREYYLLYPATICFLAPSWLIEQRYTLIPFSFLLLFRKQGRRSDEYFMAGLFLFLSLILFLGITGQKFFL